VHWGAVDLLGKGKRPVTLFRQKQPKATKEVHLWRICTGYLTKPDKCGSNLKARTRRGLRRRKNNTETLASDTADVYLLFADLVGSTGYKSRLREQGTPDVLWIMRQLTFLSRAADISRKHGGAVVKTIGDEIFVTFEATTPPVNVLSCAFAIIQAFENIKSFTGQSKIEVKISLDFGLTYNGTVSKSGPFDPIGLPVDRCARLNSQAVKNQIAFSTDFFDAICAAIGREELLAKYGPTEQEVELKGLGTLNYWAIDAS
jgi:class 3 adenylate cyclase